MGKKSKIVNNALKILEYLIERNAMIGGELTRREIFDSIQLSDAEFDSADTYLLQNKFIGGTLGGMDGSRWLTSSGIDFYEENDYVQDNDTNSERVNEMPDPKKVFVVHGRDNRLRDDFFSFLRALGLQPIEWSEALKKTGQATPYIGEALDGAFKDARAVVVLLSPDDEVRLSPSLWKENEDEWEKNLALQARPNVLFEAGMAFGTHPDRTLLVEVGRVKAFSDVAGRHVVKLSNKSTSRNDIATRLKNSGCDVSTESNDWLNTGDFTVNRTVASVPASYGSSDLSEGDILALLFDWWPKTQEMFPDNVTVRFIEVDQKLSLPLGSTKKYIEQVASRNRFKPISVGEFVAIFEYDVNSDDFGVYFQPGNE